MGANQVTLLTSRFVAAFLTPMFTNINRWELIPLPLYGIKIAYLFWQDICILQ